MNYLTHLECSHCGRDYNADQLIPAQKATPEHTVAEGRIEIDGLELNLIKKFARKSLIF